ncbi:MAG: hypothetical protein GXO91_03875 [FCB group bacterium]|nr:hypothetical protein [FCB group bacterium]
MKFLTTIIGLLILALFLGVFFRILGWIFFSLVGLTAFFLASIPGLVILVLAAALLVGGAGLLTALSVALIGGLILSIAVPLSAPFIISVLVIAWLLKRRDDQLLNKPR